MAEGKLTLDRCIADLSILYERMTPRNGIVPERSYTADIDPRAVDAAIIALNYLNIADFEIGDLLEGETDEIRKD